MINPDDLCVLPLCDLRRQGSTFTRTLSLNIGSDATSTT